MFTERRKLAFYAWSVHGFTLTGALWACLAVIALIEGHIPMMWLWLGIALIVDGVDGTLARKADVTTHAPFFDGTTLDNIVDYLTWTFIPALFMYTYIPMGPKPLAMVMLALICMSSLFCYCNTKLKTSDYYFMGFPAAWNVVAVIMWIFSTSAAVNVVVTIVLAILTTAPITFVHPFRVTKMMPVNIAASAAWIASTVVLVIQHPSMPIAALVVWGVSGLWLMGISAWRTAGELRRRRIHSPAQAICETSFQNAE